MVLANVVVGLALLIWFFLLETGIGGLLGIADRVPAGPSWMQIVFYLVAPAFVFTALLFAAFSFNNKKRGLELGVAATSALAVLPLFLFMYGGGA